MTGLPLRAKLTITFAVATLAVLAGAGAFVYARLASDFNEQVTTGLRARSRAAANLAHDSVAALRASGIGGFEESRETFAQLLTPSGTLTARVGGPRRASLDPATAARAARGPILVERRVTGIDGTARILARPIAVAEGRRVVVVGRSLDDRDEALGGVLRSFLIGGAAAIALASLLGYALATAGLRPMEAMRRRAGDLVLSGDGDLLPVTGARDEVRRLGETLNEMLGRMRHAYERERSFVADASHELRTPIAVVKTELEGALRAGNHEPQVREALLAAMEECENLAQLAEDLLVLAKAGDAGLPVRPEALAAAELLESVRLRYADRARASGRSLVVTAQAVTITGDRLRLGQALGNLVDNALRHGAGTITLTARAVPGGSELAVGDEGAGFGEKLASRAFERFARGDAARSGEGAGLGLAIVRTIAEAHGGRAVIPHPGESTVRLWLPAAVEQRARPSAFSHPGLRR